MALSSTLRVLLASFLVVTFASASPTFKIRDSPSLAITAQVNINGGNAQGFIERDLNRARSFVSGGRIDVASSDIPVGNDAIFSVIEVDVGSPPTSYTLMLDTASANTWIGAKKPYKPGGSSESTSETFSVNYGSGYAQGPQYIDTFSLGNGLSIHQQSIGDAHSTRGFDKFGIDGVFGAGPTDLTVGKLSPSKDSPIPTVMDNLSEDGQISSPSLGIYLTPFKSSTSGQLSWGHPDTSKCTSPLVTVDVASSWPASAFWGLNQELKYGDQTILSSSPGIIDSGTTLIYISPDAFQKYQSATGATMNSNVGLLELPGSQYNNLKSLFFNFGSTTVELTKNGQIWPRSLNTNIRGDKDKIYLIVRPLEGLDGLSVINGFLWMQRFYVYLDAGKKQIGIANTANTQAEIN